MKTAKVLCAVVLLVVLAIATSGTQPAKPKTGEPACAIRKLEPQVVLYTIYRGNLSDVGEAVRGLFTLAAEKGLYPSEPVRFAYLNNFAYTGSQHWLTEIRVPVDKSALSFAGTLGGFTDVKTVSAMEVAVATKPEGLDNPEVIYRSLYTWLAKRGYVPAEGPCEVFLTNAQTQDYAQMKTEIMVPLMKVSQD